MIKHSLALRVLVISFIVLALPLLVDSFLFFQNTYEDSIQDAKRTMREIADFRSYSLQEIQPIKFAFLRSVTDLLDLKKKLLKPDKQELSRELKKIANIANGSSKLSLYILEAGDGPIYPVIASSESVKEGEYLISYMRFEKFFQLTKEGVFLRYVWSENTGGYHPQLILSHVIQSQVGEKPIGMLLVMSEIQKEIDAVLENRTKQKEIEFAILTGDGIVFDATNQDLLGQYFEPLSAERKVEIINSGQLGSLSLAERNLPLLNESATPFFEFIFNDQLHIAYRSFIPDLGLSIVAYSPKEVLFGQAVKHFLFIYTVYALILVIGGGAAYLLSHWIAYPLKQLSHAMEEVREGKLDVRYQQHSFGFEINQLGSIFNSTLDSLLLHIQEAEDARVQKETYQREILIGRRAQRNLLPMTTPQIEGIELEGLYIPAKVAGGDFYSWMKKTLKNGEEALVLGIADAAGQGISTCLYALTARSLALSNSMIYDDVGEILKSTNNAFVDDAKETGMFVTLFWSLYHPRTRKLSYYSCGHVPMLIRKADGHLIELSHTGMALGLVKTLKPYNPATIQLNPGDLLILYTDGLIEAVNEKQHPFSMRRLKNCLQQRRWTTAKEAVDGLAQEVSAFTNSFPQEEEIIVVALRVL